MKKIFLFLLFFYNFNVFSIIIFTEKVGIIDMEKIFKEYYKTKNFNKEIELKRNQFKESLKFKKKILSLIDSYNKIITEIDEKNSKDSISGNNFLNINENIQNDKNNKNDSKIENNENEKNIDEVNNNEINKIKNNDRNKLVFWQDVLSNKEEKELELLEKNIEILKVYENLYKEKIRLENEIKRQKKEFMEYKTVTSNNIEKLKDEFLENILAELYEKINIISKQYNYDVIFDKRDLIFFLNITI